MDFVVSPTSNEAKKTPRMDSTVERDLGLHPSHNIVITDHADIEPVEQRKPPLLKHVSTPAYSSPLRHHQRTPSSRQVVKESLDARSEYFTSQDDGAAIHRINQYVIKQEIGRGSFGAVHLAVDQYGKEYAVKEFSKARLRKRAQSHILRQPLAQRRRGALQGFNSPLHRWGVDQKPTDKENESSINLIKEEIAIMKKLNHTNLVSLIEVLDDPSEDSLYMVMEMCKKGVVMKVDLEHEADPYPEEQCRCWFRDLILGIEYLHAQGVVHRDIKPDNCLITEDDILKVVDFGVSEMFEKDSEMKTAKSAGSPAFLPPELCIAKHGDVSGKAADIWSMGVTLYCLKFGHIPFRKHQILELYESIQTDAPDLSKDSGENFNNLMKRVLEKDPDQRITMPELRVHPWVTKDGTDPLLSEAENTAFVVEPPTEEEMDAAITGNLRSLMTVVKAVNKFKALTANKRPPQMASILDDRSELRFTHPPTSFTSEFPVPQLEHRSKSVNLDDRNPIEAMLVAEGIHRDLSQKYRETDDNFISRTQKLTQSDVKSHSDPRPRLPEKDIRSEDAVVRFADDDVRTPDDEQLPVFRSLKPHAHTTDEGGRRGQAHDPLEDTLYLYIGPSTFAGPSLDQDSSDNFMPDDDMLIVSESPGAADIDIYETAYRDEIERILARAKEQEKEPQVYLTRRVDAKLLAVSGLAGKWVAVGEEAKNQFKDYTQFSARKAKVTEVSRALREAARQEYEKRKEERRAMYDAARAERVRSQEQKAPTETLDSPRVSSPDPASEDVTSPSEVDEHQSSRTAWKGKAVDRGRQARTSLMGFVDMVKSKHRS